MNDAIVSVIIAIVGLLGGAFGSKLLDRWFDRDRQRHEQIGSDNQRTFADNEQARKWLREQLDEREEEIRQVLERERGLLEKLGELSAQVARQDERINGLAGQVEALTRLVEKREQDYQEMKAERDRYRDEKHDALNQLTPLSGHLQLAQREIKAKEEEIERLQGQVVALTGRIEGGETP